MKPTRWSKGALQNTITALPLICIIRVTVATSKMPRLGKDRLPFIAYACLVQSERRNTWRINVGTSQSHHQKTVKKAPENRRWPFHGITDALGKQPSMELKNTLHSKDHKRVAESRAKWSYCSPMACHQVMPLRQMDDMMWYKKKL